ncbi:Actinorhodin polyketide synthase acyl carrier protein [Actinomadura rubteroloni]|uniref:Actinorhodin polyketide synthase acyl carrier protein n=1 Tax=Actinomadura rubteroloni TaxID=1926885 RepID=A0A2P4UCR1_9ACTN|nr:acyl carrier protein [Actinomadura rubteroloni]POM22829.1 Actinorhodin polyketide synthase acyl carrier protein [Actinomadura rubteroloni]
MTGEQLLTILADCSGNRDLTDPGTDALHRTFEELGLDSLAVMESATRVEREFGVALPDERIVDLAGPAALLAEINSLAEHA